VIDRRIDEAELALRITASRDQAGLGLERLFGRIRHGVFSTPSKVWSSRACASGIYGYECGIGKRLSLWASAQALGQALKPFGKPFKPLGKRLNP
jgi:hypothetical protein